VKQLNFGLSVAALALAGLAACTASPSGPAIGGGGGSTTTDTAAGTDTQTSAEVGPADTATAATADTAADGAATPGDAKAGADTPDATSDGGTGELPSDAALKDGETSVGDGGGKDQVSVGDGGKTDGGGTTDVKTDGGPPPAGSCAGACGGKSKNGPCYCDTVCKSLGDCCADFSQLCGCSTDADCNKTAGADKCVTHTCEEGLCQTSTKSCNDNSECTDDKCNPATGNCDFINAAEGKVCDVPAECKVGACSKGACKVTGNDKDGAPCSDGDDCTVKDTCLAGTCKAGPPEDCDDGDLCTLDSCDPSNGCENNPVPGTPPCDDGEPCTKDDKCDGGSCKGTDLPDGTPCEDGDICTAPDACDSGTCTGKDAPKGTPCDDGESCTMNDACDGGSCSGTDLPDGTPCDDGTVCTTGDACDLGYCDGKNAAKGTPCDDGDVCTTGDACLTFGTCEGTDKICDDKNPCTQDQCDKVAGCKAVPTPVCEDGNPCTADSCSPGAKGPDCKHTPIADGSKCDDGNLCTANDACKAGTCGSTTNACTPISSDKFDCGKASTWVMLPAGSTGTTGWAIDGTPNPPAPISPACTLNFNNGKDFKSASGSEAVTGTATSAAIAVPAGAKLLIKFWSYHGVEVSSNYDQRTVEVSIDNFAGKPVFSQQLDNGKKVKAWDLVTLVVDGVGGKSVKVRFSFDSKDGNVNDGVGWFIDDVQFEQM